MGVDITRAAAAEEGGGTVSSSALFGNHPSLQSLQAACPLSHNTLPLQPHFALHQPRQAHSPLLLISRSSSIALELLGLSDRRPSLSDTS